VGHADFIPSQDSGSSGKRAVIFCERIPVLLSHEWVHVRIVKFEELGDLLLCLVRFEEKECMCSGKE
jgi:hypothetical protein